MQQLQESDLQLGDILIFEDFNFDKGKLWDKYWEGGVKGAFYYLLHYLIAWFDPGKEGENYRNIYHAGIWGNVDINRGTNLPPKFKNCVVQAGPNGIGYASLEDTLEHETVMNVYVCRLKKHKQKEDFHKKINESIREFYKEKGAYSFKTAWLLAVICSLRYDKGTLHKVLTNRFGKWIANFIVDQVLFFINEYSNHHQRDMVACSPLVAMMYKNADHELAVHVFEALQKLELSAPQFNLEELESELKKINLANTDDAKNWPAIKETVVTPRQLLESPDVRQIGFFPHKK